MKLVFVTPRFAVEGVVGGAETLIRDLARTAAAAGHEVHLLTTCALDPRTWANVRAPGEETVEGVRVHWFAVDGGRDVKRFLRLQGRIAASRPLSRREEEDWAANSVNSRTLTGWLRDQGGAADAVLAGPYLFGLILEAARAHPERTWLIPCLHDEPFARLSVVSDLFRRVRACLYNSGPERELAVSLYGLPPDHGRIVGMALDPFEADEGSFAARHGLDRPYVLYCGRQEEGKNTPMLLAYLDTYLRRRPGKTMLALTGGGGTEIPDSLAPFCRNAGFVDTREKHEAMAGARVFLHPSVNESFGIVLLESWLAGVPGLVNADCAVLRWQCAEAGAGLWFRDYADFEAMLDLLLEDDDLNRRLGENGRAHVRTRYSREAVSRRFFDALEAPA